MVDLVVVFVGFVVVLKCWFWFVVLVVLLLWVLLGFVGVEWCVDCVLGDLFVCVSVFVLVVVVSVVSVIVDIDDVLLFVLCEFLGEWLYLCSVYVLMLDYLC